MKVSVIIPTYNRAAVVGEAISSVLAQSFSDLELIVVDDGSADPTRDVLARFHDSRLQVLHQANAGTAKALAAGFARARGEYALMLGSDDRLLRRCLERLVGVAEENPEAVLVYGRAQAIDWDGRPRPQITGNPEPFPGRTLLSLLWGDFVPAVAALARRDALPTASAVDVELEGAEDWDLWVRLAEQGPFVFVDEVLAQFRLHPERSTAHRSDNIARLGAARLRVLDKAFARPGLEVDVREFRDLVYRNAYVDIGLRWLQAHRLRAAAVAFARAFRAGPSPAATAARIVTLTVFHGLVGRLPLAQSLSDEVFRRRRARRLLENSSRMPPAGR